MNTVIVNLGENRSKLVVGPSRALLDDPISDTSGNTGSGVDSAGPGRPHGHLPPIVPVSTEHFIVWPPMIVPPQKMLAAQEA